VERLIPCQPSAYQRALFSLIETELKAAEGKQRSLSLRLRFDMQCRLVRHPVQESMAQL
jgi:hypothetical protein